MSKHILILEIPGVMRGCDLLEKPREKRVTVFVSNVARDIGFYKQLLDTEKAEHMKEATRFILAMLENIYAVISSNQDVVDNKRMHWIILRNVNRVIGQIGFREKVSVDEEEIALYKEVREDLVNLFEDYLGR